MKLKLPFLQPPPACPTPPSYTQGYQILLLVLGALVAAAALYRKRSHAAPAPPASASKEVAATKALAKSKSTKKSMETSVTSTDLQALVEARRSVQPKDYTGGAVSDDAVRTILAAAPWAPNHGKTEPWRFAVYAGARKQRLLDATLRFYQAQPASFWASEFVLPSSGQPEFADAAAFTAYYEKAAADKWGRASHLVALGVRRQRPVAGKKQFPEWEETCAVACAVQNMHLSATTLKVGAYWSSWYKHFTDSDEMAREMGLDPALGDRCLGVFVLGEIRPDLTARATRLPVDEIAVWM